MHAPWAWLRPREMARQLPIRAQIERLTQQSGIGLAIFCGALVSLDLFFIAVFLADTTNALYHGNALTLGHRWRIGLDWSYSEVFGYLKTGFIALLLLLIPGRRTRPIYLAMMLVFVVVLLDDALQLHERAGRALVATLIPQSFAGWISKSFGELIVWAVLAVPLVAIAAAAFIKSPRQDRANVILLMGAFAVLVLFAVGVDLVHELVQNELLFPGAGPLFTVVEEAGEQITLSLMCGLALLVYRERRGPNPGSQLDVLLGSPR